jgi:hypothetical protein
MITCDSDTNAGVSWAGWLVMVDVLQFFGHQPRNEDIRAEDEHQAAGDDATVGKHDNDPASREEKEADVADIFKANEHS